MQDTDKLVNTAETVVEETAKKFGVKHLVIAAAVTAAAVGVVYVVRKLKSNDEVEETEAPVAPKAQAKKTEKN